MIEYPPEFNLETPGPTPEELRAHARLTAIRRAVLGVLALLLVASLALCTISVVLIRSTQTSNGPVLRETRRAARAAQDGTHRIIDCTTPGGKCFTRGQKQTAQAIGGINEFTARAVALATSCAANARGSTFEQRYQQVYDCVKSGLHASR